jgi:CheY-like chemotaxis protein
MEPGIEATREIRARRPKTQVIMLTSFADDEALFASIMAGASGYVLIESRRPLPEPVYGLRLLPMSASALSEIAHELPMACP